MLFFRQKKTLRRSAFLLIRHSKYSAMTDFSPILPTGYSHYYERLGLKNLFPPAFIADKLNNKFWKYFDTFRTDFTILY